MRAAISKFSASPDARFYISIDAEQKLQLAEEKPEVHTNFKEISLESFSQPMGWVTALMELREIDLENDGLDALKRKIFLIDMLELHRFAIEHYFSNIKITRESKVKLFNFISQIVNALNKGDVLSIPMLGKLKHELMSYNTSNNFTLLISVLGVIESTLADSEPQDYLATALQVVIEAPWASKKPMRRPLSSRRVRFFSGGGGDEGDSNDCENSLVAAAGYDPPSVVAESASANSVDLPSRANREEHSSSGVSGNSSPSAMSDAKSEDTNRSPCSSFSSHSSSSRSASPVLGGGDSMGGQAADASSQGDFGRVNPQSQGQLAHALLRDSPTTQCSTCWDGKNKSPKAFAASGDEGEQAVALYKMDWRLDEVGVDAAITSVSCTADPNDPGWCDNEGQCLSDLGMNLNIPGINFIEGQSAAWYFLCEQFHYVYAAAQACVEGEEKESKFEQKSDSYGIALNDFTVGLLGALADQDNISELNDFVAKQYHAVKVNVVVTNEHEHEHEHELFNSGDAVSEVGGLSPVLG